jgi:hypothetical protein
MCKAKNLYKIRLKPTNMNLENTPEDILTRHVKSILYAHDQGYEVQKTTATELVLSDSFCLLKKDRRKLVKTSYVLTRDSVQLVLPQFPVDFFVSFNGGCNAREFRGLMGLLKSARLVSLSAIPRRTFPKSVSLILLNDHKDNYFSRISTANAKLDDALRDLSQTYNFVTIV